jgi:hypothetical protein
MMAGAYTLSKNGHVRGDILYGFFKPDLETLCRRYPKVGIKFLSILNMIALRQLQITVNSLMKHTGESKALALQFETYYTGGLAEKG